MAIASAAIVVALIQFCARPLLSTVVILPVFAGVSAVNSMKFSYSGESLIWQDLVYALPNMGDNVGTVLQYVTVTHLICLAGLLGALALVVRLERRHMRRSGWLNAGFALVLAGLYLPTAWAGITQARAGFLDAHELTAWDFSGHRNQSSLGRFFRSFVLTNADFRYAPVGPQEFEKYAGLDSDPVAAFEKSPDIIAILQESQFHPMQLMACQGREDCRMAMFERDRSSRQLGPLHVHILGGLTWNSELAFMTGVPHTWFGGVGYLPYTVAPRTKLALGQHLKSLGYRTAVVYPVQKGMVNAFNAYRHYGMDEFFGAEALGLATNWCEVPDEVMYRHLDQTYKRLKAEDDRPIFLVMLTIFNHGPHGERCADRENTLIKADTRENMSAKKFADYLARSRAADSASKAFRDNALKGSREVLVLLAGDHQPSFEGLARQMRRKPHRPMNDSEALYFTNYQFFANFGLPREPIQSELDIMFLPSTLLEFAGVPLGPLFSANRKLRDICKGRLDLCPQGSFLDSYRHHLINTGFYQ